MYTFVSVHYKYTELTNNKTRDVKKELNEIDKNVEEARGAKLKYN